MITPTENEDTVRLDDWLAQQIEDDNVPAVAQQQLPLGEENEEIEEQQQAEAAEERAGNSAEQDENEDMPEEQEQAEVCTEAQTTNNEEGRPQRIRAKPAWYDPASYANGAIGQLTTSL